MSALIKKNLEHIKNNVLEDASIDLYIAQKNKITEILAKRGVDNVDLIGEIAQTIEDYNSKRYTGKIREAKEWLGIIIKEIPNEKT